MIVPLPQRAVMELTFDAVFDGATSQAFLRLNQHGHVAGFDVGCSIFVCAAGMSSHEKLLTCTDQDGAR